MKKINKSSEPHDSQKRKKSKPIICYPNEFIKIDEWDNYQKARLNLKKIDEITIPPREARCFSVSKKNFFKIESIEGPQVGDLNIFNQHNLHEKFYSGKTRAIHGTHLSIGDRMWSSFPYLRPMTTITHDTLDWYGFDDDGASVHDVIGTRCDPYTEKLINDKDYHFCCHSNLTKALMNKKKLSFSDAETYIHDVLNVFMCTGFTKNTHQYFMKSSPVRPGDFIEFFAEIDLLCILSACPGGDCGSEHSSDKTNCYPLKVSIFENNSKILKNWKPPDISNYKNLHDF